MAGTEKEKQEEKKSEKNNLVVNPKAHMSFAVVILGLNKGKLIFHLREYIAEM